MRKPFAKLTCVLSTLALQLAPFTSFAEGEPSTAAIDTGDRAKSHVVVNISRLDTADLFLYSISFGHYDIRA